MNHKTVFEKSKELKINLKLKREIYQHLDKIDKKIFVDFIAEELFSIYLINKINLKQKKIRKQKINRHYITGKKRKKIFEKFNYKCNLCGHKNGNVGKPEIPLHIDHVVPIKHGGTSKEENLQLLCYKCNLKKSCSLSGKYINLTKFF